MSSNAALEKIQTLRERRWKEYVDLASTIALGTEVEAGEVDRVLNAVNKHVEDLRVLVGAFEIRDKRQAEVDELLALEPQLHELRVDLAEANFMLEDAVASHQERSAPLQRAINRITLDLAQLPRKQSFLRHAEDEVKKLTDVSL